jgi:hypothetical protein
MISLATEDYFFQKKYDVAKRLITLYNLHPTDKPAQDLQVAEGVDTNFQTKGYLEKVEISNWFYTGMPDTSSEIIDNRIITLDFFGPWSIYEDSVIPKGHKKNIKGTDDEVENPNELIDKYLNLAELGVKYEDVIIISNVQQFH